VKRKKKRKGRKPFLLGEEPCAFRNEEEKKNFLLLWEKKEEFFGSF